jgi:hypothetical protein
VNVIPIKTNIPANAVSDLIKTRLAGKMFGNLHFFVNSVEFISQAIKKSGVPPEQVRVICSENNDKAKTKLGKYTIASINDKVKPINFYTSACFEGCDIYDTEGKTYIVSDKQQSHTLLDISTLIVQICGRIRDSKYKTEITHIFNNTRYKDISFEDFKANTNKERIKSLDYINEINHLSETSRTKTITLIEKGGGLNEKYVKIDNNLLVFDENLIKVDIMNYKIANQMYQSRVTLGNEYSKNGFNYQQGEYIVYQSDKLKKNTKAKTSFKDVFIEYEILKAKEPILYIGNANDRIRLIEQEKPLVKTAYDKLGADKVKELKYHVTNVKNELLKQQTDISTDRKIITYLEQKNIKVGEWKSCNEIKAILADIYHLLELKKAAKATDLKKWFDADLKQCKINGKTTDGYVIQANKYFFKDNC